MWDFLKIQGPCQFHPDFANSGSKQAWIGPVSHKSHAESKQNKLKSVVVKPGNKSKDKGKTKQVIQEGQDGPRSHTRPIELIRTITEERQAFWAISFMTGESKMWPLEC
jgi:hypothetical protein